MPQFAELSYSKVARMNRQEFTAMASSLATAWELDRKENAILHYTPASDSVRQVHLSTHQTLGVGGGNGSSKTEGCLAEIVMCCTGRIPMSLTFDPDKKWKQGETKRGTEWYVDPKTKLRGPIKVRVVCESLTNVLANIILPKL